MNTVDTPFNRLASWVHACSGYIRCSVVLAILSISLIGTHALAQVSGTIKDDTGLPLRGVTVKVKGTTKGAVSDKDGRYSIATTSTDKTLVFTLIGYAKKEVDINGRSTIDVVMSLDVQRLEDVVVVGYGSAIKKDITGSVIKVKASEIADVPVPSFDVAIQGKAAGVNVVQGSGKLGQGIRVQVRGAASISASQEPLYVLDGVPLTTSLGGFAGAFTNARSVNPLADINPQDIESIDVLKDAASAAIYGSRGANGVVLITTKKGKAGKTNINFSVQRGFSAPSRFLQFANTRQALEYFRRAAGATDRIEGIDPKSPDSYTTALLEYFEEQSLGLFKASDPDNLNGVPDTDWGRAVLRSDAPSTQIDLSISGGSDKTLFHLSGQYMDQEGIVIGNSLNRLSGRLNVEHKVSDIFKAGFNLSIARTNNNRLPGDNAFSSPLQAVALPPLVPFLDPTTNLPVGTPPGNPNVPVYYNPIIGVNHSYRRYVVLRNLGNIFGELTITEGLSLRGQFGFDVASQSEEQWFGSKTVRNSGFPLGGVYNYNEAVENFTSSLFLNYNGRFAEVVELGATAGLEYQQSQTKTQSLAAQDLPSDGFRLASAAAKPISVDARETAFSFVGYFARANVKIAEKYLLTLNARVDGSSRFGANNRYGFFPAASAGWVISEEDFLKDNEVLSFLKLRASYGLTGNAEIGNFGSRALVAGDAIYGSLSGLLPGTRPLQIPNPNLTWENTAQAEIGIDYGLLSNRISGEINVYNKLSTGLLLTVQVPGTTGFRTQVRNLGTLLNRGIEFVFNSDNINADNFSWKTTINFASNQNQVVDLQGQVLTGGIANLPSRAEAGHPLGVFYTREYAGVNPETGDAEWFVNTKKPDGTLDKTRTNVYGNAQSIHAGSPVPAWTAGVINTFNIYGFDLSFQFNAVMGNRINFYGVGQYSFAGARFEDNVTVDQLNTWSPTNKTAKLPETRYLIENGSQASSRFLLDGSFVRLRIATLGYNFSRQMFADAGIPLNSLRLYVTGFNLLTFTNYAGWDPEVNTDDFTGNIGQGIDFYTAPQPRTIMFGLSVGF
ncbi:MAG: TonB-dependent receptor [Bacteroidota bacterium]|nr:TonB-dependent receptor [Candidatus Kapabacteria bacterium]MDW8219025.1 TonB-dependent receptor [Bacteroidota bacterium]